MNYRSDIDGLRAIAVSLVVLHHADLGIFSGGYIGVDVFFVISGFLITNIVYNESISKQFSFSRFYIRRARRLMPALFTVLIVTALFSFLFLTPTDLMRFGESLIWVSIYVGNIFFWQEHGGYFGGNAQEAPLLHTWSLAVEEQYYLFWPLVIVVGLKFLKPQTFATLTLLCLLVLAGFSEWVTRNTIGAAYYLLPTRAFELLIGSALAIYWNRIPSLGSIANHGVSIVGLALILAPAVLLSPASSFPGINAIYPTVGCALLIYSNKGEAGVVNRILSYRPFVFVGLISYSLYLWHWPLFAYAKYSGIEQSPGLKLGLIILAFVLAFLSWKYVEKPFRRIPYDTLWHASKALIFKPGIVVALFAAVILVSHGLPARFSDNILAMDKALNSASHVVRSSCHSASREYDQLPQDDCSIGETVQSNRTVGLLIGDSHANHLAGFINVLADDADQSVQDYTMDQCPPIFGIQWGSSAGFANRCSKRNALAQTHIESGKFRYVLLAASWPYLGSEWLFIDGQKVVNVDERAAILKNNLRDTIGFIIDNDMIPIIFDDISSVNNVDPRCPIKRELFNNALDCRTDETSNPLMDEMLLSMESQFPTLVRINLKTIMCRNGKCDLEIGGVPLYLDADHLNLDGSNQLGHQFLKLFENPLLVGADK